MKRRQFLEFGGALVLAGVLGSCGRPSERLRYRMTIEVDTPEGLKTGSSVIEVCGVQNPNWVNPEGRGTRASFKGEAAAVELPGGKTLFALLETDGGRSDAADYPWFAFRDRLKGSNGWLESLRSLRGWKGEAAAIAGTEELREGNQIKQVSVLPLLVTFENIADPKTIRRVDPLAISATLGPGIMLRRITVTVTDDAITSEIVNRIPWLPQVYERLKGANFAPQGVPVGDFARLFSTQMR